MVFAISDITSTLSIKKNFNPFKPTPNQNKTIKYLST